MSKRKVSVTRNPPDNIDINNINETIKNKKEINMTGEAQEFTEKLPHEMHQSMEDESSNNSPPHKCECTESKIPDELLFTSEELLLMFNIIIEGNVPVKQVNVISNVLNKIDKQYNLTIGGVK